MQLIGMMKVFNFYIVILVIGVHQLAQSQTMCKAFVETPRIKTTNKFKISKAGTFFRTLRNQIEAGETGPLLGLHLLGEPNFFHTNEVPLLNGNRKINAQHLPLLMEYIKPLLASHRHGIVRVGSELQAEETLHALRFRFPDRNFKLVSLRERSIDLVDAMTASKNKDNEIIVTAHTKINLRGGGEHLSLFIDLSVSRKSNLTRLPDLLSSNPHGIEFLSIVDIYQNPAILRSSLTTLNESFPLPERFAQARPYLVEAQHFLHESASRLINGDPLPMPFMELLGRIHETKIDSEGSLHNWLAQESRDPRIPSDLGKAYNGERWQEVEVLLRSVDPLMLKTPEIPEISPPTTKFQENFLPLLEAREIASAKGFTKLADYISWIHSGEAPAGMPLQPSITYSRDPNWKGHIDFLGKKKQWYKPKIPVEEAIRQLKDLNLKSIQNDYRRWRAADPKRMEDFPFSPREYYGEAYPGDAVFLGRAEAPIQVESKESPKPQARSEKGNKYEEYDYAKLSLLRAPPSLLAGEYGYRKWRKSKPPGWEKLPPDPPAYYRSLGEWVSWQDFLSIPRFDPNDILTVSQAMTVIKTHKLPNMDEAYKNWRESDRERLRYFPENPKKHWGEFYPGDVIFLGGKVSD